MNKNIKNKGFTLIELLVTMALGAIVLSIGVPSFQQTIQTNRKATQVNQILHSLNLARSQAITRGLPVSACKSADGSTCGDASVNWEDGWIIFEDDDQDADHSELTDGNGTLDTDEEILEVVQGLVDGYTVKAKNFSTSLTYQPAGYILDSNKLQTSGYLVICLNNDINGAGAVFINIAGKARSGRDLNHNHIPEDIDGTDITSCTPT